MKHVWSRESFLISVLIAILWLKIIIIKGHCDLLIDNRIECGFPGIERIQCEDRSCCWIPFSNKDLRNPPWCFKQANKSCGYRQISSNSLEDQCNSTRYANLTVQYMDNTILRVKITRSIGEYHVPFVLNPKIEPTGSANLSELLYESFKDLWGNFNFKIVRRSDNETLWDTNLKDNQSMSSIQMKNQYTQIGSTLPSNHCIYGLGYNAGPLKIPENCRLTLFSRDFPTAEHQNLYSSHPFYIQFQNGKWHGVYMRNSFGMDVIVSKQSIKFKMLGGPIDLFFFAGESPLEVLSQYTKIIGSPGMFDYRILGFHQSRYGYRNVNQIHHVLDGFEREQIPLDAIWLDIDYMDEKRDFTFDTVNFPISEMRKLLKRLEITNRRVVPILDPGIKIDANYSTYLRGVSKDIFIQNPANIFQNNRYYVGEVWPGKVHFIDFTHRNSTQFWIEELELFFGNFENHREVIAGLWLDMNEPSNFIDGYNYNFADYPRDYTSFSLNFPRYSLNNGGDESPIYQKTLPMDTKAEAGNLYQTHNMYGIFESKVTCEALKTMNPDKRPFLLTRSTFPGSGAWTATWLGDNMSTFPQMALSLTGVLQYGLAGIPISGPDICGFLGNVSEELCARWMALGSFYPFSRNHNSISSTQDQEPYNWKSVAQISRKYLKLRYSLHSYYYTLMHTSHVMGWPLWRPIFFHDNSDEARFIDDQVFIGGDLLLSPVLLEASRSLIVRLPKGEWYEWDSFNFVKSTSRAIKIEYSAPIDFISLHLRAGSIILQQDAKMTLFETRKSKFKLLIAFNSSGKASGIVYWDDGVSISSQNHTIQIESEMEMAHEMIHVVFSGFNDKVESMPRINEILVLTAGMQIKPVKNESQYNFTMNNETGNFNLMLTKLHPLNETIRINFE